jgi:hypothetical protein
VLVPLLLLAAPLVAAALAWGSWGAFAVCLLIALVQYQSLRHTEQFSTRIWRTVGKGRRGRQARAAEVAYLLSAAAGVIVLVVVIVADP